MRRAAQTTASRCGPNTLLHTICVHLAAKWHRAVHVQSHKHLYFLLTHRGPRTPPTVYLHHPSITGVPHKWHIAAQPLLQPRPSKAHTNSMSKAASARTLQSNQSYNCIMEPRALGAGQVCAGATAAGDVCDLFLHVYH